jgi:hypothetical protein
LTQIYSDEKKEREKKEEREIFVNYSFYEYRTMMTYQIYYD